MIKNPPVNAGRYGFDPWVEKIPWRRTQQPIPVFLLGESHEHRAWLAAVCGVAELDVTEEPEHTQA